MLNNDHTIDSEVDRIVLGVRNCYAGLRSSENLPIPWMTDKEAAHTITNLIAQEANKARLEQTVHLQVAEQKFGKVDWQAAIYELEPREKMT